MILTHTKYAQANICEPCCRNNGVIPSKTSGRKVPSILAKGDKESLQCNEKIAYGDERVPLIFV